MADSKSRSVEVKLRVSEDLLLNAELDSVVKLMSVDLRRELVQITQDEEFVEKKKQRLLNKLRADKQMLESDIQRMENESSGGVQPVIVENPISGKPEISYE